MTADAVSHGRTNKRPARKQFSDEAASYIRGMIMSGELRPGESVRPEVIGVRRWGS